MPSNNFLDDLISRLDKVNNLGKSIPALVGTVALIIDGFKKTPTAFYGGIVLIVLTLLWFIFKRLTDRLRPKKPIVDTGSATAPGSYIRGLLPFEQRDKLLGRDIEQKDINTIINSSDYKFGYISGEAGCGKTSFIRSIVMNEAKNSSLFPLNLKSIAGDPIKAINQSIVKEIGPSSGSPDIKENIALLHDKYNQGIIIIIDQFEEFFIAIKSAQERKEIIIKLCDLLTHEKADVKILLGLRKEFVDDLQEFSPEIDQPTDKRFALRIKNWDIDLAKEILRNITEIDKLRFSLQLQNELINDLCQDGFIRPVEFQIVAKSLLDAKIYDFTGYNTVGRASGLLASYIKEIIDPKDHTASELEKQITRTILRNLCDERNDTKRPVGLSAEELLDHVKNTIENSPHKDLILDRQAFTNGFRTTLNSLFRLYVVKYEDDQKINLVHDYIVYPIRLATSDIETTEEQANRLLKKYIQDQRSISGITIPVRHYKFIKRNASYELKKDINATKLLTRTRRRIQLYNSSPAFFFLVIITALFPPKIRETRTNIWMTNAASWDQSASRNIFWGQTRDSTYIYGLAPSLHLVKVIRRTEIVVSPDSRWVVIPDSSGTGIYQYVSDSGLSEKFKIGELPFFRTAKNMSFGVIRNRSFFSMIGENGNLYMVDLTKEDPASPPLFVHSFDTNFVWRQSIETSPASGFFWGIRIQPDSTSHSNSRKSVYCLTMDNAGKWHLTTIVKGLSSSSFADNNTEMISHNDSVLAFFASGKINIRTTPIGGSGAISSDSILPRPMSSFSSENISMAFSPDDNWIINREISGSTEALHIKDGMSYIIENSKNTTSTSYTSYGSQFKFSPNGKYCSFTDKNRSLYLISLGKISTVNAFAKPLITDDEIEYWRNQDENYPSCVFSPDNKFYLANSLTGYVYYATLGSSIDLNKPIAYYGGNNPVKMYWSIRPDFVYTFSNDRISFGAPSAELKEVDIRIGSKIEYLTTSGDSSQLLALFHNGIVGISRKLYLWNLIPIKSYTWPKIIPEVR